MNVAEPSGQTGLPIVRLKILRRSSHPWIFQKMVAKPERKLPGGSVVNVLDRDGQWVGRGFYNGHSRIALRILTEDQNESINEEFFACRLDQAIALRRSWLRLDEETDAYRLVHSEGDALSGLVVDRFGSVIVIEYFAAGMYRFHSVICQLLTARFPNSEIYWFAEEHVQKQESIDIRSPAPPRSTVIHEHGVRFRVAPGAKHKTGFFLDQRENRLAFAELCRTNEEGKRVLDICCNTGGFAVYAKVKGNADEVIGVDLDEAALALARENANLNQARIRFVQADLFPWLRDAIANRQRFDVVVLDPSKQTRDREQVNAALRRYLDMNRLAMQVVAPGGILLTCSCTGLVKEEDFLETIRRSAYQAGRNVQILRLSGAGPDHPFLAHVQEGRYLKAIWCRVM